ncbi:MAG: MoaD/ThiS family protein [Nitrospira sp.]|nr:MoaD/ThiS family protein [Nitrospira sp.]
MVILDAAIEGSQFASLAKTVASQLRDAASTEDSPRMITITLMGQLQTTDGERDLACELPVPVTVRQVIQRQGRGLRHMLQLLREKKVLVTINKRIASEDSIVQDGDAVRFVGHDGAGGSGLAPSF